MLIYIILILLNNDLINAHFDESTENRYIAQLPQKEKKVFLEKVARRILEEVKSGEAGLDAATHEVSDEQLKQHNDFVSKLLKEEAENLRRRHLDANDTDIIIKPLEKTLKKDSEDETDKEIHDIKRVIEKIERIENENVNNNHTSSKEAHKVTNNTQTRRTENENVNNNHTSSKEAYKVTIKTERTENEHVSNNHTSSNKAHKVTNKTQKERKENKKVNKNHTSSNKAHKVTNNIQTDRIESKKVNTNHTSSNEAHEVKNNTQTDRIESEKVNNKHTSSNETHEVTNNTQIKSKDNNDRDIESSTLKINNDDQDKLQQKKQDVPKSQEQDNTYRLEKDKIDKSDTSNLTFDKEEVETPENIFNSHEKTDRIVDLTLRAGIDIEDKYLSPNKTLIQNKTNFPIPIANKSRKDHKPEPDSIEITFVNDKDYKDDFKNEDKIPVKVVYSDGHNETPLISRKSNSANTILQGNASTSRLSNVINSRKNHPKNKMMSNKVHQIENEPENQVSRSKIKSNVTGDTDISDIKIENSTVSADNIENHTVQGKINETLSDTMQSNNSLEQTSDIMSVAILQESTTETESSSITDASSTASSIVNSTELSSSDRFISTTVKENLESTTHIEEVQHTQIVNYDANDNETVSDLVLTSNITGSTTEEIVKARTVHITSYSESSCENLTATEGEDVKLQAHNATVSPKYTYTQIVKIDSNDQTVPNAILTPNTADIANNATERIIEMRTAYITGYAEKHDENMTISTAKNAKLTLYNVTASPKYSTENVTLENKDIKSSINVSFYVQKLSDKDDSYDNGSLNEQKAPKISENSSKRPNDLNRVEKSIPNKEIKEEDSTKQNIENLNDKATATDPSDLLKHKETEVQQNIAITMASLTTPEIKEKLEIIHAVEIPVKIDNGSVVIVEDVTKENSPSQKEITSVITRTKKALRDALNPGVHAKDNSHTARKEYVIWELLPGQNPFIKQEKRKKQFKKQNPKSYPKISSHLLAKKEIDDDTELPSQLEQPNYAPVYNFAPENAFFNPKNIYWPNDDDDKIKLVDERSDEYDAHDLKKIFDYDIVSRVHKHNNTYPKSDNIVLTTTKTPTKKSKNRVSEDYYFGEFNRNKGVIKDDVKVLLRILKNKCHGNSCKNQIMIVEEDTKASSNSDESQDKTWLDKELPITHIREIESVSKEVSRNLPKSHVNSINRDHKKINKREAHYFIFKIPNKLRKINQLRLENLQKLYNTNNVRKPAKYLRSILRSKKPTQSGKSNSKVVVSTRNLNNNKTKNNISEVKNKKKLKKKKGKTSKKKISHKNRTYDDLLQLKRKKPEKLADVNYWQTNYLRIDSMESSEYVDDISSGEPETLKKNDLRIKKTLHNNAKSNNQVDSKVVVSTSNLNNNKTKNNSSEVKHKKKLKKKKSKKNKKKISHKNRTSDDLLQLKRKKPEKLADVNYWQTNYLRIDSMESSEYVDDISSGEPETLRKNDLRIKKTLHNNAKSNNQVDSKVVVSTSNLNNNKTKNNSSEVKHKNKLKKKKSKKNKKKISHKNRTSEDLYDDLLQLKRKKPEKLADVNYWQTDYLRTLDSTESSEYLDDISSAEPETLKTFNFTTVYLILNETDKDIEKHKKIFKVYKDMLYLPAKKKKKYDGNDLRITKNLHNNAKSNNQVDAYVNVMRDMIKANAESLRQYNWLVTTVDIRTALTKLNRLSDTLTKDRDDIHPKDLQIVKYILYLFSTVQNLINEDEENPTIKKFPYAEEDSQDYPDHLRYVQRRHNNVVVERPWMSKKGIKERMAEFSTFAKELEDVLDDFHEAIKQIALVTKYRSQKWFENLKDLYLTDSRKNVLEIILHLEMARFFWLIEESASNGLDENYVRYAMANPKNVEAAKDELAFVVELFKELKKLQ